MLWESKEMRWRKEPKTTEDKIEEFEEFVLQMIESLEDRICRIERVLLLDNGDKNEKR